MECILTSTSSYKQPPNLHGTSVTSREQLTSTTSWAQFPGTTVSLMDVLSKPGPNSKTFSCSRPVSSQVYSQTQKIERLALWWGSLTNEKKIYWIAKHTGSAKYLLKCKSLCNCRKNPKRQEQPPWTTNIIITSIMTKPFWWWLKNLRSGLGMYHS